MPDRSDPVGVFDSGIGGISVLSELIRVLPGEDFIYFGDSLHAPYGTKSPKEVCGLTFAAAEGLFAAGCKGLVLACNTATSAAVRPLRERYLNVPIVGIEPALKPAVLCGPHPRILVMATPMTIHEEKFQNLLARHEDEAQITPLPCPGLMEFIERGDTDGADLRTYLLNLLAPYIGSVDAVVLGCTHYPFAREMIREILGEGVLLFDGGAGTARQMKRRLLEADLLQTRQQRGTVRIYNSGPKERVVLCRKLLET